MSNFSMRFTPPAQPISFDTSKCVNCNRCVEACMVDVLLPAPENSQTPVAVYPDECWYCGCCVMECPTGAIELRHPLMNQARWVAKDTLIKK